MSRIKRGMILLFVVLLICVGLGIADFTMSSNGSIKEGVASCSGSPSCLRSHTPVKININLGDETNRSMGLAY